MRELTEGQCEEVVSIVKELAYKPSSRIEVFSDGQGFVLHTMEFPTPHSPPGWMRGATDSADDLAVANQGQHMALVLSVEWYNDQGDPANPQIPLSVRAAERLQTFLPYVGRVERICNLVYIDSAIPTAGRQALYDKIAEEASADPGPGAAYVGHTYSGDSGDDVQQDVEDCFIEGMTFRYTAPIRPRWLPLFLWRRIPWREVAIPRKATLTVQPIWKYPHAAEIQPLGRPIEAVEVWPEHFTESWHR